MDTENQKETQPIENQEVEENKMDNQVESQADNQEESQAAEESDKGNQEVEELKAKNEALHNDYLRLYADFENYKRRTLKEKAELIKSAGENIFGNILPLIDDFERAQKAMASATDVDSVKEGVSLIYNKFIAFLAQNGVKEIDTKEKAFDTDFHEAIAKIPAPSEELKGKVVDCTQKGYTLNEKVIRYAKVVIGE